MSTCRVVVLLLLLFTFDINRAKKCEDFDAVVSPVMDVPRDSYIDECQDETAHLVLANVKFYGYDGGAPSNEVDAFTPAVNGGMSVTINPSATGPASGLTWDVTSDNNCMEMSETTKTTAYCQFSFQISDFTTSSYLDYESTSQSGFKYEARIQMYRNDNNGAGAPSCVWEVSGNVSVHIRDCNEPPAFDPPPTTTISEYNKIDSKFSGTGGKLYLSDPDIYNPIFGNNTVSIVSVYRPRAGNSGVDLTPFYLSPTKIVNRNATTLYYDVSRCAAVSKCLDIFDALHDNGNASPYYSELAVVVKAIDGGGLSASTTVTITITQASPSLSSSAVPKVAQKASTQPTPPSFIRNTVIAEDAQMQDCLYDISPHISNAKSNTTFFYTIDSVTARAGSTAMWYLEDSKICYNASVSGPQGTCCGRYFRSDYGPYVITVQIKDQLDSPTPYPKFTYSVTILADIGDIADMEDFPELTEMTDFNVRMRRSTSDLVITAPTFVTTPESWTNLTFAVSAVQNNPSPSGTNLSFSIAGTSPTCCSQIFFVSGVTFTNTTYVEADIAAMGSGLYWFDYATYPVIYVNISVTDGVNITMETVIVYVQFINRQPDVLNLPYSVILNESLTGFGVLYTVSVYDKENDAISYQFIDGLTVTSTFGYFSIDYNLGVIYYNNPTFDFYATSAYTAIVLVQDHPTASPTKNATSLFNFTVSILWNNKEPTFTTPLPGHGQLNATVEILENVTTAAVIYTFESYDRDNDTAITYNIIKIMPVTNDAFNIDPLSPLLEYSPLYTTSSPMFVYASVSLYLIAVEVMDSYLVATSTATITVSILEAEKPPVWSSLPAEITIREDVSVGPTEVYIIGANDPHGNATTLSYLGVTPSSGSSKFFFNTTTNGFGYVNDPQFSYATESSYYALFSATNTLGRTITGSLVITIEKINTGPFNNDSIYTYTTTFAENTVYGSLIWDLRVSSNQSLTLSYSLRSVTPNSAAFTVSSDGLVRLNDNPNFDYSLVQSYSVLITASDTGLGGDTQNMVTTFTLTVSITEADQQPVITNLPDFVRIREGVPGAGAIFSPRCKDPRDKTVSYSYDVVPTSGAAYFTLNTTTGIVSTTASATFSYADQSYYRVVVYCNNTALTATATLTIAITWTSTTQGPTAATTPPLVPVASPTTTSSPSSSTVLSDEQIGIICGSVGGALVLAAIAFTIARVMQQKTAESGIRNNMKNPMANVNELYMN